MKSKLELFQVRLICAVALGIGSSLSLAAGAAREVVSVERGASEDGERESVERGALVRRSDAPTLYAPRLPWSQLGAKAGADYHGDGLGVSPTADGARLRCVFQRLEGEVTREGLWLTSTVTNPVNDRFRIVAAAVGREAENVEGNVERGASEDVERGASERQSVEPSLHASRSHASRSHALADAGTVAIDGQTARFTRPRLVEEYSVSMDGVRQDFIIEQPPVGAGPLRVELAVTGAKVEPLAGGAQLVLENSGRKIAYSRLRVTDATGKELSARMEVRPVGDEVTSLRLSSESRKPRAEMSQSLPMNGRDAFHRVPIVPGADQGRGGTRPYLVVLVNDAEAMYPVRIDPTFSDANWVSMNPSIPGASGLVTAAVVDGSGNLYIGGDFTVVGEVSANNIAKWNGSGWTALGSGMNGYVSALAVSGSDVYAGGYFTTAGGNAANYIAKWNGSGWTALGSGLNGEVNALAVSGSELYAGGWFTAVGGSAANYIAKWDGSSWTALGSGMGGPPNGSYPYVYALAVSGSDLYAGGGFGTAGGSTANRIAKWNGSSWTALGSGIGGGYVLALAVSGSDLYAGGSFTTAGGNAANYIAKWNGSSWTALDSGMSDDVLALAVSGNDVYAGGLFKTAGGSAANYIAKWDGSSWTALGSGMNLYGYVYALAVSGNDVYAGGTFTTAGGSAANYVAKWDGSSWTALASGMNRDVLALAVSGSDLYAGGYFTTAGGSAANYVAKWNGTSWSALGTGMNSTVLTLAVSGSDLYAGGYFTTAGGSAANYIAKWDGTSWSALGSGMNSGVGALAVSGSDLYAGGYFTTAGDSAANYIAKWDGSSWSALGSGIGRSSYPSVNALAVSGSDLYAGGAFTTAGGSAANYIAKWNGSSWSALGSGMNDTVWALAVSGSDVYAGGQFGAAGVNATNHIASATNYIAKWNGSSWTSLGSGMNHWVWVLAVSGSNVYAGGYFTAAGGSAANYIAKWDGSNWTALGSGMNSQVKALAVSGSNVYAGGDFTTAGGKVSAYVARAYLPTLPALSVLRSGTDVTVSWPSADTASFTLEQAGTLAAPPSWVTITASVTDDGTNKSVTIPATNSLQFFRLRRP